MDSVARIRPKSMVEEIKEAIKRLFKQEQLIASDLRDFMTYGRYHYNSQKCLEDTIAHIEVKLQNNAFKGYVVQDITTLPSEDRDIIKQMYTNRGFGFEILTNRKIAIAAITW